MAHMQLPIIAANVDSDAGVGVDDSVEAGANVSGDSGDDRVTSKATDLTY